jgi:hypothetical protein
MANLCMRLLYDEDHNQTPAPAAASRQAPAISALETAGLAPDAMVSLADEESPQLEELLARTARDPHSDFEDFAFEAKLAFHELPRRLRRILLRFREGGNLDGALLLRGLPQDPDLPPTPVRSGVRTPKATFASELWLCAAAAALGEPVGYLQEKHGTIIQDVFPTPANAGKQSSESSEVLLAFHTEIAFHPFMPDYVLLYGLRQDPEKEARTMFASVRRLLPLLGAADRDILFADLFRTGIDYSFGNHAQERGTGPLISVLYGDRLDPFLRYDLDLMVGQTEAARRALEHLRQAVDAVKLDVRIEPGSLLVLDNRRAVHARTHFKAAFDGRDRWLQRVSVVRDLEPSLHDRARGSRVIATDFSRYLGAAAGAAGGGEAPVPALGG